MKPEHSILAIYGRWKLPHEIPAKNAEHNMERHGSQHRGAEKN